MSLGLPSTVLPMLEAEYLAAQEKAFPVGMILSGLEKRPLSHSNFNPLDETGIFDPEWNRRTNSQKREKRKSNVMAGVKSAHNWDKLSAIWNAAKRKYEDYKELYNTVYTDFIKNHDIKSALAKTDGSAPALAELIGRYEMLGGRLYNAEIVEQYPGAPTISPAYIDIYGAIVPRNKWASSIERYTTVADENAAPTSAPRRLSFAPSQVGGRRRTKRRKGIRTRRR